VDHIEETHSEVIGEGGTTPREKQNCAKMQKKNKKIPQKKMLVIMKKWNLLQKKQKKATDSSYVLLKGVQCQHCLFRATDQDLLNNHMEDQHNNNNDLKPSITELKKTSSKKRTKDDKEKILPKQNEAAKDGFFIINGLRCQHCLFHATDQDLIKNHIEDQHNNNTGSLKSRTSKPKKTSPKKRTKERKGKNLSNQNSITLKDGFFIINGLQCHNCKFWATSKDLMDSHNNLKMKK